MSHPAGVAVAILNPQRHHHVLDLCCAPGAKLCYLYDWMQQKGLAEGADAPAMGESDAVPIVTLTAVILLSSLPCAQGPSLEWTATISAYVPHDELI